jgi:hypothetical protein
MNSFLLKENLNHLSLAIENLRHEKEVANYKFEQRSKSILFQAKKYRDEIEKNENAIKSIINLCRSGK